MVLDMEYQRQYNKENPRIYEQIERRTVMVNEIMEFITRFDPEVGQAIDS